MERGRVEKGIQIGQTYQVTVGSITRTISKTENEKPRNGFSLCQEYIQVHNISVNKTTVMLLEMSEIAAFSLGLDFNVKCMIQFLWRVL